MNAVQIIAGVVLTVVGFYGRNQFSPAVFVEGMILLNLGVGRLFARKSIAHL